MEIKNAQIDVDKRVKSYGGYWSELSMYARLVEEVGELGRALNIKFGGKKKKSEDDGNELEDEIGDVFFTLLAICNKLDVDLEKVFMSKNEKTHEVYKKVYN
ncbi:MAG: MazG nucleotide pyrophosphohydrolase domain-containing protein [Candidatus Woesearchaeota archaeon]